MRKIILFALSAVLFCSAANAQFFAPLHKPAAKFGDRLGASLTLDSIVSSIRPVAIISGITSTGEQLAGGAGIGFQRNKWDATSQSFITEYSVSAVGLLGTNGNKITGTVGIVIGVPGTNGLVGIGGGRDLTQGVYVLLTGVQIKFN